MDNTSNSTLLVVLVVLIVAAAAAWFYLRKRRTETLKSRFGPEYEREMKHQGNSAKAEAALEQRAKRVEKFKIVELSQADRDRFSNEWRDDQAKFVDDPKGAVIDADRILTEVMRTRGYPMGEFEQLAADVSVDHPKVVENYRTAHLIAVRSDRGEADTEDLRKAMVHYRALFEDLLGNTTSAQTREVRR